ncbi:MAG: branched-chain amino acid transaminase [Planctomycetota bacterium]
MRSSPQDAEKSRRENLEAHAAQVRCAEDDNMQCTNKYAFFQGDIVPIEQAKISIMTVGLNYGTGVFEGIRAFWAAEEEQLYVFRLREHFERFARNCAFLMIELPYTVDQLCGTTLRLLQREGYRTDCYIRPLGYKSTCAIGVRLHGFASECAIFAIPFGEYLDRPQGARLQISSWRRIDDNAIPARCKITGAYVNSALAKTEAVLNGFDDALMLCSDGRVSEASAANLFIVREGTLITPPVTDDILEGITRSTFMTLAGDLGLPVLERSLDRSELYSADEAFLCGTGVGIVPVIEVDRRPIANGEAGTITRELRALYQRVVHGQEARYRHWCSAVYSAPALAKAEKVVA